MQSITTDIIKAIKINFPLLLIYSGVITALPLIFSDTSQFAGGNFVVTTLIIYFLHRQVLYDLPMSLLGKATAPEGTDMPKDSMGRFVLVSLLFTLLFITPALFVAYQWAVNAQGRLNRDQFTGMTFIVSIPLLWILLSTIGTALPAAASKLPFSLRSAFHAGRKAGLRVALQLLIYPGLTTIAAFGLVVLLGKAFADTAISAPVSFGMNVVIGAVFMIPSVMTVVILVRAFRTAYPKA